MLRDFFIMFTIFLLLLLWHPWAGVDSEIINSVQTQLRTDVEYDFNWNILGGTVLLYNDTMSLGHYYVDYFGNTQTVNTYRGKLDPTSMRPLPVIKGYFDYELGQIFTVSPSYIPDRLIKAYGIKISFESEYLQIVEVRNGTFLSEYNCYRNIKEEEGRISHSVVIVTDNRSVISGTLVEIDFRVIKTGYTYIYTEEKFVVGDERIDLDTGIEVIVLK